MQAHQYRSFTIKVVLHSLYAGEHTTSTLVSYAGRPWRYFGLNKDDPTRDSYHCVFLAKHPNDANKSDEFTRFWTE